MDDWGSDSRDDGLVPKGDHRKRISAEWIPRFWARVEKTDGCWLWLGARDRDGYGQLKRLKRQEKAHRLSWELAHGPIPEGVLALHHCDNPPCVKPEHLFLGSEADNAADRERKRRGDNQWHKIPRNHHPLIRARLSAGATQTAIALEYGVVPSRIWAIQKGGDAKWMPTSEKTS